MNTIIKTTDGSEFVIGKERTFEEVFLEINAIKNSKDDCFFHFEQKNLKRVINVNYIVSIIQKPIPQFRSANRV